MHVTLQELTNELQNWQLTTCHSSEKVSKPAQHINLSILLAVMPFAVKKQ